VADESYYLRFWRRFIKDATPWARDNIIWGLIVLVVPPLFVYFRNRRAQIDWTVTKSTIWLYLIFLSAYILVHLCRTPAKLDADRDVNEKSLSAALAERDETILRLSAKPQRTPAEQHYYDVAKKTLQQFGPKAAIALRHLKTHGSLTFGTYNPQFLPPGLTASEAIWAYNACAGEGVVTCRENPRMGERTFQIAPPMNQVLDELLYEGAGSQSA
jgi:hypothetical protein